MEITLLHLIGLKKFYPGDIGILGSFATFDKIVIELESKTRYQKCPVKNLVYLSSLNGLSISHVNQVCHWITSLGQLKNYV